MKNYLIIMESSNNYTSQCGIAERAAHREKEETSAVSLQSGSDDKWWSDNMECCNYLRDDEGLLADGKSENERRFGESFWDMLCSRGEFGKKIFRLQRLMNGEVRCIRNSSQKTECERSPENTKRRSICIFVADGSATVSVRDYEFQEPTLRREFTVRREINCHHIEPRVQLACREGLF